MDKIDRRTVLKASAAAAATCVVGASAHENAWADRRMDAARGYAVSGSGNISGAVLECAVIDTKPEAETV